MSDKEPSRLIFTCRGVRFIVLGTQEADRTSIRYRIVLEEGVRVLEAHVKCSMKNKENDAAHAQREAWDYMMWDLVSANPQQTLIRYVEPELTPITPDVSLRTLTFHAPAGEPSRCFYVSTGDERGVYILALDDDTLCLSKERKRQLLEKYAWRTLYEPLNENQKSPERQDLDEECVLQKLLPLVFTSAFDLDGTQPLHLTVALAAIHYIIVKIDAWRGPKQQFYTCRNELRIRKVTPMTDGNRVMIKEEGDVLFIILPLDCTKQSFCDILLAALHGYAAYIFTKVLTDVIVPGGVLPQAALLQRQSRAGVFLLPEYRKEGGTRVRLESAQQQNDWWTALTLDVYHNFYSGSNDLLQAGYDAQDVKRIQLYCYSDTQHDVPEIEALESSPYRHIISSVYEKMESLRKQLLGVSTPLIEAWAVEARAVVTENPNNYLGIFDKDSRFHQELSAIVCPLPVAPVTPPAPLPMALLEPLEPLPELPQKRAAEEEVQKTEIQYYPGRLKDSGYRHIVRESVLFSLYANEEHVLDHDSLQRAAAFLQEYGFVLLSDDYFDDQSLDMVTQSLAHQLTQLYVGKAALQPARKPPPNPSKLSDYLEPSSLSNFPISRGLCQLDVEPLLYDKAVWQEIRGSEKLYESFRGIVEHTSEGSSWKQKPVQLQLLPPTTTHRKSGTPRQFRIHWRLAPNPAAPTMGMVAVNSMEQPAEGGLVLAPRFQQRAAAVYSSIKADEQAKRYYFDLAHLHTLPYSAQEPRLPPLIRQLLEGEEGLLKNLAFLPLRPGDLVLWSENMPHSWLRSDNSNSISLGQLYSLKSLETPLSTQQQRRLETLIASGQLPYKLEGRQKKEMRMQENSKPRSPDWVWLNWSPDPAQSEVEKKRDAGWKWAAALDHSNEHTYHSGWIFDAKTNSWIKKKMDKLECIPASYNYCSFFCGKDRATQQLRKFTFGTPSTSPTASASNNRNNHNHQNGKRRRMPSSALMMRSTANGRNGTTATGPLQETMEDLMEHLDTLLTTIKTNLAEDVEEKEGEEEEEVEEEDRDIVSKLEDSIDNIIMEQLQGPTSREEVFEILEESLIPLLEMEDEVLLEDVGEPSEELNAALQKQIEHIRDFIANEENAEVEQVVVELRSQAEKLMRDLEDGAETHITNPGILQHLTSKLEELPDMEALRNRDLLLDKLSSLHDALQSSQELGSVDFSSLRFLLQSKQKVNRLLSELKELPLGMQLTDQMLRDVDDTVVFMRSVFRYLSPKDVPFSSQLETALAPLYDEGFTKERSRADDDFTQPDKLRERIRQFIENVHTMLQSFDDPSFRFATAIREELQLLATKWDIPTVSRQEEEEEEVIEMVEEEEEEEDALSLIERRLPALEELVSQELSRDEWQKLAGQIQLRLTRLQDTIQKNLGEERVLSELTTLIKGLRSRRKKESKGSALTPKLRTIQSELVELRKLLPRPSPVIVPETPPPEKRKRTPEPAPIVVLTREPSVEEQLQPHGVEPAVIRSILSMVSHQRYSMTHQLAGEEEEVPVGSVELDGVAYKEEQSRIEVDVTIPRGALRLTRDDTLALYFSDQLVARVTVTSSLLTEKTAVTHLLTPSGEETVVLTLTSTPRGDIIIAHWLLPLDTTVRLLAARGPDRPTKRPRLEEKSVLAETLEQLFSNAVRIKDGLDRRFRRSGLTSHIQYQAAVNAIVAAQRAAPQEMRHDLTERAREAHQRLLKDVRKEAGRIKQGSSKADLYKKALEELSVADTLLEKGGALQLLLEMEALLQPPFSSEALQKVAQNVGAAREKVEADTKIPNKLILESQQLLEEEEGAGELRGLLQQFLERHKKSITRIRKKPQPKPSPPSEPMEVEEEEVWPDSLNSLKPTPLNDLASPPTQAQQKQLYKHLKAAASLFSSLDSRIQQHQPQSASIEALQQNIVALQQRIAEAASQAKAGDWDELLDTLNQLIPKEWFLLSTSIQNSNSPLYYEEDAQRLLRDNSSLFLSALTKLHAAYTQLSSLMQPATPTEQQAAQEEMDPFDVEREVIRTELRARQRAEVAAEIHIPGGAMERKKKRSKLREASPAGQSRFEMI